MQDPSFPSVVKQDFSDAKKVLLGKLDDWPAFSAGKISLCSPNGNGNGKSASASSLADRPSLAPTFSAANDII